MTAASELHELLNVLIALTAVCRNVAIIAGCVASGYGIVKGLGILRSRVDVQRENVRLKEQAIEAKRDAAEAASVVALRDRSIDWLTKSFTQFQERFEELEKRFEHTNQMFASAVLYIVDLHQHKSGKTPLPPIPEDLRTEIEAALERRTLAEATATMELEPATPTVLTS